MGHAKVVATPRILDRFATFGLPAGEKSNCTDLKRNH